MINTWLNYTKWHNSCNTGFYRKLLVLKYFCWSNWQKNKTPENFRQCKFMVWKEHVRCAHKGSCFERSALAWLSSLTTVLIHEKLFQGGGGWASGSWRIVVNMSSNASDHLVSVPDPKPTPVWIAFSIVHYTGSDICAGWGLGTRLVFTLQVKKAVMNKGLGKKRGQWENL